MNLKDSFEIIDRIDNLTDDVSEEVSELLSDIYYLLVMDCKATFDAIVEEYETVSASPIKEPQQKPKAEKTSPEKPTKTTKSVRAKQNKPMYDDEFEGLI